MPRNGFFFFPMSGEARGITGGPPLAPAAPAPPADDLETIFVACFPPPLAIVAPTREDSLPDEQQSHFRSKQTATLCFSKLPPTFVTAAPTGQGGSHVPSLLLSYSFNFQIIRVVYVKCSFSIFRTTKVLFR